MATRSTHSLRAGRALKRLTASLLLGLLAGSAVAQSGGGSDKAPAEKFGCHAAAPGTMATEKALHACPLDVRAIRLFLHGRHAGALLGNRQPFGGPMAAGLLLP